MRETLRTCLDPIHVADTFIAQAQSYLDKKPLFSAPPEFCLKVDAEKMVSLKAILDSTLSVIALSRKAI